IDPNLSEWDYGEFEGMTTKDIQSKVRNWDIFRDGCPGGESPQQISDRADRVIARLKKFKNAVLIFAHAHFLRVLATRWILLPVKEGRCFMLKTSSLSILSYEHNQNEPAIKLWNDVGDLS